MLTRNDLSERPALRKLRDGQQVLIRRLTALDRLQAAEAAQASLAKAEAGSDMDKVRVNQLAQCDLVMRAVVRRRWFGLFAPVPMFSSAEDALRRLSLDRIGELADLVAEVNGIAIGGANPNP